MDFNPVGLPCAGINSGRCVECRGIATGVCLLLLVAQCSVARAFDSTVDTNKLPPNTARDVAVIGDGPASTDLPSVLRD